MNTDSNLYKLLQKNEEVSNLHEIEEKTIEEISYFDFGFDFANMKFLGTQVTNPLFTLNKLTLVFVYNLKKETTRATIFDALNDYNGERPLTKATLSNYKGKKIKIIFSSEFISDDQAIDNRLVEPLINIMAPCAIDFVNFLERKKIAIIRN